MTERFNAGTWLVDRHVESGDGHRTAFICGPQSITYAELAKLSERAAAGLRAAGVRSEERVALALRDSIELAALILGTMRMGAVAVPLNPMLPAPDVAGIIENARARMVLLEEGAAELAGLLRSISDVERVVTVGASPSVTTGLSWQELISSDGDGRPASTFDESQGFWLCTSGTTGRPKLAMHRHIDLRTTADGYAHEILQVQPSDRHLSTAPMFHAYGLGNSLTFPLAAGASTVLEPSRPPKPQVVAELVQRHRPTLFFAVPTFYAALLNANLPGTTFNCVRQAVSAGEALPAELYTRFREQFGVEILDGIGSTEMTHIFISNR
ncbi:MAG: AMP-binding protein, partial [Candidatus Dormibacteraeota bacterium]|nr:AMP-binding protein [Candidatus Dormibacteraeota bacterium]